TVQPLAFRAAKADVSQIDAAEGRPNGADVDGHSALTRRFLGAPADQRSKAETHDQYGEKAGSRDREGPSISPPWGDELPRSEGQPAFPHAGPPLSVGDRPAGCEVHALRVDAVFGFV